MAGLEEGRKLWEPSDELKAESNLTRYTELLKSRRGHDFSDYQSLWEWSVHEPEAFWGSIWNHFDVQADQSYRKVLGRREMPGAEWFPGARLNFAEHLFRNSSPDRPAMIHESEGRPRTTIPWSDFEQQTAEVAASLRDLGVKKGDRVVGYLSNVPEAVVAFAACSSIGAIWSCCSPDFGARSVVERFRQIEPKVLFAVDGYRYGGTDYDRRDVVRELQGKLPGLEKTVLIRDLHPGKTPESLDGNTVAWEQFPAEGASLDFEPVPFDHPLWVLYSSGTTGPPKPIVHGHGGVLLELLKALHFHHDLTPEDRFFWVTTTGWMMWNYLVGGLLLGCPIVLFDGDPTHPGPGRLWSLVADLNVTVFGTSAPYIHHCMTRGLRPGEEHNLSELISLGSTGAPLTPEGFGWAYENVKEDLWVASASGGTDLCTAFVTGCPLLPVRAGELQCRALGANVRAYNQQGQPVVGEAGELVITEPMPSMPIRFWGDPDMQRYRASYFETFPGIWRHGDWIKITPRGSAVIYGRSDATINRRGVRFGTSEIYRAIEDMEEIEDSLVVHVTDNRSESWLPLFVVPSEGMEPTPELRETIRERIRTRLSPRHKPDSIHEVPEIPRTLSGKKMEVPIQKILRGVDPEDAARRDSMSNPESLDTFVEIARTHSPLYSNG